MRHILGHDLAESTELSSDAWRAVLTDGTAVVVKRVPRQSRHTWRPGRPWAELVALDLLCAEGGPVPKLLAVDLERGHLVLSYVEGVTLRSIEAPRGDGTFAALDRALAKSEAILEEADDELRPFLEEPAAAERTEMFERVRRLLQPDAAEAWRHLLALGFKEEVDGLRLGSLDLQPENAITDGRQVTLIDFASLGRLDRERRLIAYVHRAHPVPGTLLHRDGYDDYCKRWGLDAGMRLAAYDFAFIAPVFETALARQMSLPAVETLITMWQRHRLADPRVDEVRFGLNRVILQELDKLR